MTFVTDHSDDYDKTRLLRNTPVISNGGVLIDENTDTERRLANHSADSMHAPVAIELPDRYRTVTEFAKGGMGRVLLVHDAHLDREVALKELLPGHTDDSTPDLAEHKKEMTARFVLEAKITGQLEHPSITPVHELGRRQDGSLYYTMKLIRGKTLTDAIKAAGSLEARLKLLPHFIDLCNAIAYAHSRGVIHRDIKPSNVMIGDFGETIVIDWGLAKVKGSKDAATWDPMAETIIAIKSGKEEDIANTRFGVAMGTPAYMPPEQATGDLSAIDERSDIYSLGAVMYEMLTGRPPYSGGSGQEIIRRLVTQDPPSILTLEKNVSRELVRICQKAMYKDPERRMASAAEIACRIRYATHEKAFLNPLRPYTTDLVPQLNLMSKQQQKAVKQEATLRLWKNRRLSLRFAILNWLLILYFVGAGGLIYSTATLSALNSDYQAMDEQVTTLKSIVYGMAKPGQFPEWFYERGQRASDQFFKTPREMKRLITVLGLGVVLVVLAGALLLMGFLTHVRRRTLAPYIREVIAECEVQGCIVCTAREGRKLQTLQALAIGLGAGLGSVIAILLHRWLGFGIMSQGLFVIAGITAGAMVATTSIYLYFVRPWRAAMDE